MQRFEASVTPPKSASLEGP